MPRLVHITPETNRRAIERGGIRARPWRSLGLAQAVFAMPATADFSISHQWLRELRRGHDGRMVAVHFVAPSDEPVLVGHYGAPLERTTLSEAIRAVVRAPSGNQIVLARSVPKRDVVAVRDTTQLVGWTRVSPGTRDIDCVCAWCLRPGDRRLMRRVRAEIDRRLTDARRAATPEDAARAIEAAVTALERAGRRIDPGPWLRLARSPHAAVRGAVAPLLSYLKPADTGETVVRMLDDDEPTVWRAALRTVWRIFGPMGALEPLARTSVDTRVVYVDELMEYLDAEAMLPVLERMLEDDDAPVRWAVRRAAIALLDVAVEAELEGGRRERLEDIVSRANERAWRDMAAGAT